jgi:hypothetical protein
LLRRVKPCLNLLDGEYAAVLADGVSVSHAGDIVSDGARGVRRR